MNTIVALLPILVILAVFAFVIYWRRKIVRDLRPGLRDLSRDDRRTVRGAYKNKTVPSDPMLAERLRWVAENQITVLDRSRRTVNLAYILIGLGAAIRIVALFIGHNIEDSLTDVLWSLFFDAIILTALPISRRAQRTGAQKILALYPTAA